jgi:hypothetical protein
MLNGHCRIGEFDKIEAVESSSIDMGFEPETLGRVRIVSTDRLARDLMPIVEPVAWVNIIGAEQSLHGDLL